MTVRVTNLQNRPGGVPAEDHRLIRAFWLPTPASPLHGFAGVLPAAAGHLGEVTLLSPEAIVVNPARWVIPGTQAGTQGDYYTVNDAPAERPVGARDATLTRIDRLAVRVRDTMYEPNDGVDDADVVVLPGTPALNGATAPALPPNSLNLGTITVPPGAGVVTFTPAVVPMQGVVGGVQIIRTGDPRTAEKGGYDRALRDHPQWGLQRWSDASQAWDDLVIDRIRTINAADVSLTSTGHPFQLGADNGPNLAMDPNQILARNNGTPAYLGINTESDGNGNTGDVQIGPSTFHGDYPDTDYRYRSLEVERLRITTTNDAQAKAGTTNPSHLHGLQIGPSNAQHVIADTNEMLSRNADFTLADFFIHGLIVDPPTKAGHAVRLDYVTGPIVRVRRHQSGNVPTGTWTLITWTIADHDTDGMAVAGSANVTVRRSGYYSITAGFSTGPSAVGRRGVRVMRNGAITTIGRLSPWAEANGGGQSDIGIEAGGDFYFAEGDTCQVQGYQDSGISVGTGTVDFSYPSLSMHWLRS